MCQTDTRSDLVLQGRRWLSATGEALGVGNWGELGGKVYGTGGWAGCGGREMRGGGKGWGFGEEPGPEESSWARGFSPSEYGSPTSHVPCVVVAPLLGCASLL